jgi:energy-converting hydrogenase Eha subunit G
MTEKKKDCDMIRGFNLGWGFWLAGFLFAWFITLSAFLLAMLGTGIICTAQGLLQLV